MQRFSHETSRGAGKKVHEKCKRHQYVMFLTAEKYYSRRRHNKTAIKAGYSWLNNQNNKISNLSSDLGEIW